MYGYSVGGYRMDSTAAPSAVDGVPHSGGEQVRRDGFFAGARMLKTHPAVTHHGRGVSSAELANYQQMFCDLAGTRIGGVGDAEYGSADGQAFESKTTGALLNDVLEELADGINYLVMCAVKVQVLQRQVVDLNGRELG